ncbi:hypothetical protein BvCmsKSP026_03144 [Escherichia coli]|nr:hypothetical protein BvCmsKSP009_00967 [Escherichia coli]GDK18187.1 hypothetical protein BvCmsKSP026_03144 [Escherichia coli]GDK61603.1 hypothetical protein BvCmsKSP001_01684 [Escherichia coli]
MPSSSSKAGQMPLFLSARRQTHSWSIHRPPYECPARILWLLPRCSETSPYPGYRHRFSLSPGIRPLCPLPLSPLSGWLPSFHHHCPLRCLTAQFPSVPSSHQPHLQRCLPDLALHEVPEVRSLLVRLSDLQDQVHLGGQSPHAHLVLPSVPVVRLLLVHL